MRGATLTEYRNPNPGRHDTDEILPCHSCRIFHCSDRWNFKRAAECPGNLGAFDRLKREFDTKAAQVEAKLNMLIALTGKTAAAIDADLTAPDPGARFYYFQEDYPCVGCKYQYDCDSAYTDGAEFCPVGNG